MRFYLLTRYNKYLPYFQKKFYILNGNAVTHGCFALITYVPHLGKQGEARAGFRESHF